MKSFTTAFILFLLFAINANAGWEVQNPLPQGNSLMKIKFATKNIGWAVGYYGTIVKTTNAGQNWIVQNSTVSDSLYGISCIDSLNVWVCGDNGTIVHTTDGGESWTKVNSPYVYHLNNISFYNADIGLAVGFYGEIMKTTDGGSSWSLMDSIIKSTLFNILLLDQKSYCIIGYEAILNTSDGGYSWNVQKLNNQHFRDGYFINSKTGWSVGSYGNDSGQIAKTTDGGLSWNIQKKSINVILYNVFFCDSLRGWATSGYGTIFKTNDGGSNWIKINCDSIGWLNSIFFTDTATGYLASNNGAIYKSTDGGNSWFKLYKSFIEEDLNCVYFTDSTTGWILGDKGKLLKTSNGGKDWVIQPNNFLVSGSTNIDFMDISFLNANYGWLVTGNHIYKTTNGGKDWLPSPALEWGMWTVFRKIQFLDSLNGWIAGGTDDHGYSYGVIVNTGDGGKNWDYNQYSGDWYHFNDMQFFDSQNGMAIGPYSYYSTNDGGNSWIQHDKNDQVFSDIFFLDQKNIWMVGYHSSMSNRPPLLLKSTDGGSSWIDKSDKLDIVADNIFFTDSLNGWASSGNDKIIPSRKGKIIKTTDGGETWTDDNSPAIKTINGLFMNSSSSGWAVGAGGTIIRYTAGIASPLLETPEDKIHADTSGILLAWFRVSNADNYQVRVSDSSDFKDLLADEVTSETSYVFNQIEKNKTYYWTVRAMNAKDTSAWSEVRSFNTYPETSVPDYKSNDQVLVFPNPTEGKISIRFNSDAARTQVRIFDMLGTQAFSSEFTGTIGTDKLVLDLSRLNSGIYYILINADGRKYSSKLALIK